jgi:hypothetical protein
MRQTEDQNPYSLILFHGSAPGRDAYSAYLFRNHADDRIETFNTLPEAIAARNKEVEAFRAAAREGRVYKRPAERKREEQQAEAERRQAELAAHKRAQHSARVSASRLHSEPIDNNTFDDFDTSNTFDFEAWFNSDQTISDLEEEYAAQ